MADLSVNHGGLKLKNPIIVASGPLTANIDRVQRACESGAGAVSLKHALIKQKFYAKPRWYAEKGVGILVSGDPRLTAPEAQELVRQSKEKTDMAILVNMSALADDIDSWGRLAKEFEQAGADAIELNLNCPNLHTAQEEGRLLGANLGQDPQSCGEVVANIKNAGVKIPVIAKLPTEGGRMIQVAQSCEANGVDILNIHAGFRAAAGLNIYDGGTMRFPGSATGPFGGCSGPWSRLISNRFIADTYRACKNTALMGGGGITKWEHVVEAIMYGLMSVQICTHIMVEGFEVVTKMLADIEKYMDQMGYKTIEDFCALAVQNITGPGEMPYADIAAYIDPERCTGCGKCLKMPTCDAVSKDGKLCKVDPGACVGCGLCVCVCPRDAFSFKEKS